jgi:hypothetical protein
MVVVGHREHTVFELGQCVGICVCVASAERVEVKEVLDRERHREGRVAEGEQKVGVFFS